MAQWTPQRKPQASKSMPSYVRLGRNGNGSAYGDRTRLFVRFLAAFSGIATVGEGSIASGQTVSRLISLNRVLRCYITWPAYTKSRSRVLQKVLQSATRGATRHLRVATRP